MTLSQGHRRIVLIETPFPSQTGTAEVKAYVHSKYNLALLALGSYIKEHSDFDVSLINMVKGRLSEKMLLKQLQQSPPTIVGISLYSYNMSISYRIIEQVKRAYPHVHVCVGGPHVNIYPQETLALKHIDSIVLGDGEIPFLELCRLVISQKGLNNHQLPPGVYTKESLAQQTPLCPYYVESLDELPLPDFTLLGDYRRYTDFLSNRVAAFLVSSRGCPYACHYCLSQRNAYRPLSVERVVAMMATCKRLGIEHIEFWDETFNPNLQRLRHFANALEQANLDLTWFIRGAVVNHIDLETMQRLKRVGLRLIQFGVESGNERLLKYYNKRIDRQKIKRAFDICRQVGVRTIANLLIGALGQTKTELLSDLELLKEIRPNYININIYNWAPGTIHYQSALTSGLFANDFWRDFASSPTGPEPVQHPPAGIPIEEIYKLRSRFISRFYFNLRYIIHYLKLIDPREFIRAAHIALLMSLSVLRSLRPGGKNL